MSNGINFNKFVEVTDSLEAIDELESQTKKDNQTKLDSTQSDIEQVLQNLSLDANDPYASTYINLKSDLETINESIDKLFANTPTDEVLDEFLSLQDEVFGQEYQTDWSFSHHDMTDADTGGIIKNKTTDILEPDLFGNDISSASAYPYGRGDVDIDYGSGWGGSSREGKRKYLFSDEDLYMNYANEIINDPNASQELKDGANSFIEYMSKKTKLEELGGDEMPHYVIPPTKEWDNYTRVNPREFNVSGSYAAGFLYEGPKEESLWEFPKMRNLNFVKKYGGKGGMIGSDPIESYAKDTGLTGRVFEEYMKTMPGAYDFAQYVQSDFKEKNKKYYEMKHSLLGDEEGNYSGEPVTLEDGTQIHLEDFQKNLASLKKLYGEKDKILDLLSELALENK